MNRGKLYIVATPIGNLEDITYRAVKVLKDVDLIGVEDTRHSGILLKHYGIDTQTVSYFEHNEEKRSSELVNKLESGMNIAIISDAGTPTISDPGYRLISSATQKGIQIIPIPGASSVLTALTASGFPTDRFCFEGFLPKKKGKKTKLEKLSSEERTMVFFESPQRIVKTLSELLFHFGDRRAVAARELTKMYEEFHRGNISELVDYFTNTKPRGEFVLIIEGKKVEKKKINKYAEFSNCAD